MPVTDGERVNVFDRRVIGAVDFDDRLLTFLEQGQRRHLKGMLTGAAGSADPGAWLAPATVTDGAGSDDLTFGSMYGTDGTGEFISVDAGDARITDVPFENTGAVTYYLATRVESVPEGVQVDTETGDVAYDYHRRGIGHLEEPTVVVDSGGFITLTLGNHDLGTDDFTGREAIVYLKTPVATTAVTAIETVTISGTTAVTTGSLGQSTISTTATDYEVILVGPTITRSISVATANKWAYIGTVVGAASPRTFDTSSQTALLSLSELSDMNGELLSKGWTDRPTYSFSGGGATIDIDTAGVVFTQGRLLKTPSGAALTGFPVSADVWISYNVIAGDFQVFTTWDTANAGTNVPLIWGFTDGSSLLTEATSIRIGRVVKEFPQALMLTLADDAEHAGAFRSIRQMLAHLIGLLDSATVKPASFRVHVLGQVDISNAAGTVTQDELFGVRNVHFIGAEKYNTTAPGEGATFQWSPNTSALFTVGSGVTMSGWTFEGISFRHRGTPSSGQVSVVHNSGTVEGLKFVRCHIGFGTLPGVVYSVDTLADVSLIDCRIEVSDVVISHTVAAMDGISGLRIRDCVIDQTGLTKVGSDAGVVRDLSTGGVESNDWRLQDNKATLNGEFLICEEMLGCWIRDNDISVVNVDARAVDIGTSSPLSDVDSVFVHDNWVHYPGAAAFTLSGAIRVRSGNGSRTTSAGTLTGIIVHSNYVEGTGYTAGNGTGMDFQGGGADGMVIGLNMVRSFTDGLIIGAGSGFGTGGESVLVIGNVIEGGDGCFSTLLTNSVFIGNIGHTQNNSSIVLVEDGGGDNVVMGNSLSAVGSFTTTAIDMGTGDEQVLIGNWLVATVAIDAIASSQNCIVGNRMSGTTSWSSSQVMVGNRFTSATHDFTDSGGHTLTGNDFNGDIVDIDDACVVTGNRFRGLTFDAVRLVMTGNLIDDASSSNAFGSTAQYMAITGNLWRDSPGFNTTSADWSLTGNVFEDATAWSLDSHSGAMAGNLIRPALTLAAGSGDICVVGNRLNGGALTDNGTGNTAPATTNDT